MSKESLVVELEGKTGTLATDLKKVSKGLDDVESSSGKADSSMLSFTSAASGTVSVAASLVKGIAAASTALGAFVTVAAKSAQETSNLAMVAGESAKEFSALSFATAQYNIDAKATADAMNDVNERLGEFSVGDGAGAFDDFRMAMGLSKDEAIKLTNELKEMSGQDALTALVSKMEDANLSTADMNFVMKSLSNDLAYIAPLFANNAKELKTLKDRYKEVNDQLALTSGQQEGLKGVATSFDLMTTSLGSASKVIASSLAPQFDAFFNAVIDIVPNATNTIVDFINKFKDAQDIKDPKSITRMITDQEEKLVTLNRALSGYNESQVAYNFSEAERARLINETTAAIKEETDRLEDLKEQKKELQEVEKREGGSFTTTTDSQDLNTSGTSETNEDSAEAIDNDLQARLDANQAIIESYQDRYQTEKELLAEKLQTELDAVDENTALKQEKLDAELESKLEKVGDNEEAKIEILEEYAQMEFDTDTENNLLKEDMEQKYQDNITEIDARAQAKRDAAADAEVDAEKRRQRIKLLAASYYVSAAKSLNTLLFNDNKALAAGLIVADTAVAAMKAYKEVPYPANIPASIAAVAAGAVQLQNANSASYGGGSISSSSSAVGYTEPEIASSVTVSESDTSGGNQQITLKIDADDSDVAASIAAILDSAKLTGTLA